jgi:hypothetical protein
MGGAIDSLCRRRDPGSGKAQLALVTEVHRKVLHKVKAQSYHCTPKTFLVYSDPN